MHKELFPREPKTLCRNNSQSTCEPANEMGDSECIDVKARETLRVNSVLSPGKKEQTQKVAVFGLLPYCCIASNKQTKRVHIVFPFNLFFPPGRLNFLSLLTRGMQLFSLNDVPDRKKALLQPQAAGNRNLSTNPTHAFIKANALPDCLN